MYLATTFQRTHTNSFFTYLCVYLLRQSSTSTSHKLQRPRFQTRFANPGGYISSAILLCRTLQSVANTISRLSLHGFYRLEKHRCFPNVISNCCHCHVPRRNLPASMRPYIHLTLLFHKLTQIYFVCITAIIDSSILYRAGGLILSSFWRLQLGIP